MTVNPPLKSLVCGYVPVVIVPSPATMTRIHGLGQPAAEHPDARVHCLLDNRTSSVPDGGQVLGGDVVHRVAGERNQIPRHLTTPFSSHSNTGPGLGP